jgi:hypothetical protein
MANTKKKSFSVQLKTLKINSYPEIVDYLRDKKILILNTTNSHNYGKVGTVVKLTSPTLGLSGGSGNNYTQLYSGIPSGNTIGFSSFHVLIAQTEEELLAEIKALEKSKKDIDKEIELCKNKIEFIKETGSKEFNENEFKAFNVLKTIDNGKLTRIEKARLIASLVSE